MSYFNLPENTKVNRVIPKNAFDDYMKRGQKKLFTDYIEKIRWTHKISKETTNLDFSQVSEIQVFEIELKLKIEIPKLLEVMQKAIPYHIIFVVNFENDIYISTSKKHLNPVNEDQAVIDWTFTTDWFSKENFHYSLTLKKSIDFVYQQFCKQLTGDADANDLPIEEVIQKEQKIKTLKHTISILKSKIKKEKQFNKKVDLNLELKSKEKELEQLKK